MTQPLVSIITSCYNHEKYLDDYFHGLLSQTYPNIELILYDDGSTDESWKKIQSYEGQLRGKFTRVVCERHENMSARKELALAIKEARGEYLCWIDSDDYYLSTKIEENVKYLEAHPGAGVVHNDFDVLLNGKGIIKQFWKSKGREIPQGHVFDQLILHEFYILPVPSCFRTSLVLRYVDFGKYFEKGYLMADLPMSLDLARHTQFGYIDKSLARYRLVPGSMSHPTDPAKAIRFHKAIYQVKFDYANQYGISEVVRKNLVKNYYKGLYNTAYTYCFKPDCLEGYSWLLENYPSEYANRWHGLRAISTRNKLLWKLVKFMQEGKVIHNTKQWLRGKAANGKESANTRSSSVSS